MEQIEFILDSKHNNKKILVDARWKSDEVKPIIIFVHGFKGFKDWGTFNLVADYFANEGFALFKLNLSHNGTTPEAPLDFADLEAFGNNNYTIELDDIEVLIDHIFSENCQVPKIDLEKLNIIGHSRGGGVCVLKAREDDRINKIATWASVNSVGTSISGEEREKWEKEGVRYVYNGRTKQNMPMYWQIYENVNQNKERFDVLEAASELKQNFLIIHGSEDPTIPVKAAHDIKNAQPNAEVYIIEGANHVFGGSHPYLEAELPEELQKVVLKTKAFFSA